MWVTNLDKVLSQSKYLYTIKESYMCCAKLLSLNQIAGIKYFKIFRFYFNNFSKMKGEGFFPEYHLCTGLQTAECKY